MWVIRDGDSFNKGILSILLLNLCAQFLLFSRSMPYFKKQQPIWYLSIKRYGMVIWYCKLWQLSKMGKQGASTHLQKETLPRHFRIKWNFLLTYIRMTLIVWARSGEMRKFRFTLVWQYLFKIGSHFKNLWPLRSRKSIKNFISGVKWFP